MLSDILTIHPDDAYDILKKIDESGQIIVERPDKDKYYLDIALCVSKRSTCLKRHYGAVIVNNDEIIATGYNGNPRGMFNCCKRGKCNRMNKPHNTGDYSDCFSVHAEQNAMLSASRRDMIGGMLYLAAEEYNENGLLYEIYDVSPCPICLRMILNSGIKFIITRDENGVCKKLEV